MSVVGSEWDAMKRFNVYELYEAALKKPAAKTEPSQKEEAEASTKG